MDFVQAVVAEAGIYPSGAENRQSEWTWHVASCLELPAVVARDCEKNDFQIEKLEAISEQWDLCSLFRLV